MSIYPYYPQKKFINGDINALDDVIKIETLDERKFIRHYLPESGGVLLSDYLHLIDGRMITAMIQPSKNKMMAEFIGFEKDDDGIYIRSHQDLASPFQPERNMRLQSAGGRDFWERKPLPHCKTVKEGMQYLFRLATSLEASKEIVAESFAKAISPQDKPHTSASTPFKATLRSALIPDSALVNIEGYTADRILEIINHDPIGIAKLYPITALNDAFSLKFDGIGRTTRSELKNACKLRKLLFIASEYLDENYIKQTDVMLSDDIKNSIEKIDESYALDNGASRFLDDHHLLHHELEQCRNHSNFDEKYMEIKHLIKSNLM